MPSVQSRARLHSAQGGQLLSRHTTLPAIGKQTLIAATISSFLDLCTTCHADHPGGLPGGVFVHPGLLCCRVRRQLRLWGSLRAKWQVLQEEEAVPRGLGQHVEAHAGVSQLRAHHLPGGW